MAEQITEPLLTCEAVLAETAFHLQDVGLVLEMIADGLVALSFDCRNREDRWRCSIGWAQRCDSVFQR